MMRLVCMGGLILSGCYTADIMVNPPDAGSEAGRLGQCIDCPDVEWVKIPGGSFVMGDNAVPIRSPEHRVTLPDFWMSRVEVTVASYEACVANGACQSASTHTGCTADLGDSELPINCVSWLEAYDFARWIGGSLPSEAQWAYAALSAGQTQRFPWGEEEASCAHAVTEGCASEAQIVCSVRGGESAQTLCDLIGNVAEWTGDDWHDDYEGAPTDEQSWLSPHNPGESLWTTPQPAKVVRGGSYLGSIDTARTRFRARHDRGSREVGFRVVRATPP
jgi:formylglycine-generating enzyme